MRNIRHARGVYYAAFFLQGFFGLVCQVVWQRDLMLLLGGSLYSTAAIFTSYMAGLALGNWLGASPRRVLRTKGFTPKSRSSLPRSSWLFPCSRDC